MNAVFIHQLKRCTRVVSVNIITLTYLVSYKINPCGGFFIPIARFKSGKSTAKSSQNIFDLLKTMPKDNAAMVELRRLRVKAKAIVHKKPQVPPSEVFLSVLGNGAKGTPRCLCVFTDHKRYIFNCGEGTQRLACEHKMKLSKIEHIFFTHKSWRNLGGLPGLTLTIQDLGVPDVTIHGPPDIEKLYPLTQHFMITKNLQIKFRPYADGVFEDNCFRVTPVSLLSSKTIPRRAEQVVSMLGMNAEDRSESDDPDPKRVCLSPENSQDIAVAYICKLIPTPGHLLLEKCVDLGVPCGPLLGELKNGNDITLEDGTIVKASDVVTPPEPVQLFIVLECPDESFLDSLLSAKDFESHQQDKDKVTVVVHFTPHTVIRHPKYQQWTQRFDSKTTHLYLNSEHLLPSLVGVHQLQHQLNLLEPSIFPKLATHTEVSSDLPADNHSPTRSLARFHLRPKIGFDESTIVQLEPDVYVEELKNIPEFPSLLHDLHKRLEGLFQNAPQCPDYPSIVFLGTGSAIPSKVRNVSSILVEISATSCLLLDCGEGTYGQLLRFHGIAETASILTRMNTIFISHLHADHHMGILEILLRREEEIREAGKEFFPVNVIAPGFLLDYLNGYHKVFQPVLHLFRFVPSTVLDSLQRFIQPEEEKLLLDGAELTQITTVFVRHCRQAYGLTFTMKSGIKIVYSGDTMPSFRLVDAGKDCSILIHEATMEDELEHEAVLKAHSTTSQAIEIGQQMNAKFTILTHFSQRYPKVPLINDNFSNVVGIAFDNMKVQMADLPKLPLIIPVLKCMFHEHYESMQEKSTKKRNNAMNVLAATAFRT